MANIPLARSQPITVFVHVHYPDIWEDISDFIAERLVVPFRLVLTTTDEAATLSLPQTHHLVSYRIMRIENRGRDILPFLRALAYEEDFEVGLKLHTKKSPQRTDGSHWRTELLESLLPGNGCTQSISQRIFDNRHIGLVTPAGYCLPVKPWILTNWAAMQRAMEVVGDGLHEVDMEDAYFAAGSMFWFRRSALAALSDTRIMSLFEPEEGQLDGTMAHGMERLFAVEARRQNFLTVAMPVLMASCPGTKTSEINLATKTHSQQPSFLFPAPYEAPASSAPVRLSRLTRLMYRFAPLYRALPFSLRRWLRDVLRS